MIYNVIVVVCVLYLIFGISDLDCRFRLTTTALQEIWAGACARRCLNPHTYTVQDHNYEIQNDYNCCCDICSCSFFENAIRICNPSYISFQIIMSSLNEMLHTVVQTVHATYNYFVEMIHGMLNQTQSSEEAGMLNVTSGSEQALAVQRTDKTAVAKVKPAVEAKEKPKVEAKKSNLSLKKKPEKVSSKTESIKMKESKIIEKVPVIDSSTGPIKNLVATIAGPPGKNEVGTDADKPTVETTSPKCTRCIEKNVFCNQECPNTKTSNRID